jgi:hypothetical protein
MSDSMKMPDKDLSREGWLDIVKPVEMAGRLDKIPARKPVTKKDHDIARKQNYWLSRRSFGMPGSYDCINWGKEHRGKHDTAINPTESTSTD